LDSLLALEMHSPLTEPCACIYDMQVDT